MSTPRIVYTLDELDPRPVWDEAGTERIVWGIQAYVDFMQACDVIAVVPGMATTHLGHGIQVVAPVYVPAAEPAAPVVVALGRQPGSAAVGYHPAPIAHNVTPGTELELTTAKAAVGSSQAKAGVILRAPAAKLESAGPSMTIEVIGCP